jgi:hypothetical protein
VIETRGRKGSIVLEMAPASARERRAGLDAAADALVIVARQLGAEEDAAIDAVKRAWGRI